MRRIQLVPDPKYPNLPADTAAMKPEIARLLVDALRSGDYVQGPTGWHRGQLRCRNYIDDPSDDEFYSPIGILCDLYFWETGNGEWSIDRKASGSSGNTYTFSIDWEESTWAMPSAVKEWCGLELGTIFLQGQHYWKLEGWDWDTFEQLADLIEKEYCVES